MANAIFRDHIPEWEVNVSVKRNDIVGTFTLSQLWSQHLALFKSPVSLPSRLFSIKVLPQHSVIDHYSRRTQINTDQKSQASFKRPFKMTDTNQSIDQLVAALDGLDLKVVNLQRLEDQLKAEGGELPVFDVSSRHAGPGSRSHEINISSPVTDLLPPNKTVFLPQPKLMPYREKPLVGKYGTRLDRLLYNVRYSTDSKVSDTPKPRALPDLGMFEYVEALKTHPGVSKFEMVAFEHNDQIYHICRITTVLFAQSEKGVWRSLPETRTFTLDHKDWLSAVEHAQRGSFAAHLEHVEFRGCDTSYLIARHRLRAFSALFSEIEEEKLEEVWGEGWKGISKGALQKEHFLFSFSRPSTLDYLAKTSWKHGLSGVGILNRSIIASPKSKTKGETISVGLPCNHNNRVSRHILTDEAAALDYRCTECGERAISQSKQELIWLWKQTDDRRMRAYELKFFEGLRSKRPADLPSMLQVSSALVKKEMTESVKMTIPGPSVLYGRLHYQLESETAMLLSYFTSDDHCNEPSMQIVLEDDLTLRKWFAKALTLLKWQIGVEDDNTLEAALPPFFFENLYRWLSFTVLKLSSRYQYGNLDDEPEDGDYEPSESEEPSETGSEALSEEETDDENSSDDEDDAQGDDESAMDTD